MSDAKPVAGSSLRDLTRASVREQITARALILFDRDGFDETTVDDIADEVGLSARSFFRYFAAKEDVVLGDHTILGELVRDTATARPDGEPAWRTLRHALDPVATFTMADATRGLRAMRVMMSTPGLRARNLEKHIVWATLLEPVIENRLGGAVETRRFRSQAFVHAALGCLDVAFAEWTRLEGATPLPALLDEAFGVLS